jgi:hypothetical protein
VTSTQSNANIRPRLAGALLIVVLGVGVAACSSSSKTTTPPLATVQTPPTQAQLPSTLAAPQKGKPAPELAEAAITQYETKHGPKLGTWVITSLQASTSDPSFVMYRISPASAKDINVQGGYGFAHEFGGKWSVVAFGSSEVGCPPGAPGNATIPPTVLSTFDLTCPS